MRVLITGATGMVGKGVLLECLADDQIKTVVLLSRSQSDVKNDKIQEVILKDFEQIPTIKDKLGHLDACFHNMGVSAIGLSEEKYDQLTFGITKALVDVCFEINPQMVFNYVSGTGTDSSEKGRVMWARVKGKAENYILNKGFKQAYMFRPGMIIPEKGIKSKTGWYQAIYNVLRPLFPLFKQLKTITTTTKLGLAMIKTLTHSYHIQHLENQEINKIAEGGEL